MSANDEVRCDCTFADDCSASWYSVCRVPMVEWRLYCEDCRHLTVVGLHDTGPSSYVVFFCEEWCAHGAVRGEKVNLACKEVTCGRGHIVTACDPVGFVGWCLACSRDVTAWCSCLSRSDQGPVSWRPMTVKWRQSSQSNRHSTIGTQQTEYHEALPSSANVQSHFTSSFADDGNASWYSGFVECQWRLDCEDCRHLTVVGLHDTGPRWDKCASCRPEIEAADPAGCLKLSTYLTQSQNTDTRPASRSTDPITPGVWQGSH